MPKGVFVVQSAPAEGQDEKFNEWYTNTHIPEILSVPGFVSARRFKIFAADGDKHAYLAIYELDADDLTVPMAEMRNRSTSGQMTAPVTEFAKPPITTLYEQID